MLTINNFEKTIDEKILKRGYSYFNDDSIIEFEKVGRFLYKGVVLGMKIYDSSIELDNELKIKRVTCNCPFNYGPYCKHQVAMMYLISELRAYYPSFKSKGKFQELSKALKSLKKKEIIELLQSLCLADRSIMNSLLREVGISDETYEESTDNFHDDGDYY